MKKTFLISCSLLVISLLWLSCNKEEPIPPTIVNGQVLEQGSNKPLKGVKIVLMEGTFNSSSGTNSYYPIDTFLTDKQGKYSYEHKLAESQKTYELWYFNNQYFDISNISNNEKTTRVKLNETLATNIKMIPFAWLMIRVINEKPFDTNDQVKIGGPWEAGGLEDRYYGDNVNIIIYKKTRGGEKAGITWWIYKNNSAKFNKDSLYIKPHDTTFYEIKY